MCFKVNEKCPRCGVRTGVVYYHKEDNCPNDPMTCNRNVEKDLSATGSRFLDLRCNTPGCLFSHVERERNEAQYRGLGHRVIIVTPNVTIRLDEGIEDPVVINAAAILTGVAKKEEGSNVSLPGLRPDRKPVTKSESVGPVEMPMHQHPAYPIVPDYEYDEQGRPIRQPLGRTRLPNGRMPLPTSRPPLASLRNNAPSPPSCEIATSGRYTVSGPNPQRNNNTNAAANFIAANAGRLAPVPRFTTSPTPQAQSIQSTGNAQTTNQPANTLEAAGDFPSGNTNTSRQVSSGRRLPEIPGRNGMTAVLVSRATPDRPPKWQYRSIGRLRLEDLPRQQAQEIRDLKARMDERVNWQTSVPGAVNGVGGRGGNAQGPRYVLEEDQLLQLLRLSGFGYEQIQREFIPRRSQDSLTVRRKGHKKGIHVRGFQYIPDNGFMTASETDSGESDHAPVQQEAAGGENEGGAGVQLAQPVQQSVTKQEDDVVVTGENEATGKEENSAKEVKSEDNAQEDTGDSHGHEVDDGNDADDEPEPDDANDAQDRDGSHNEQEEYRANDADGEHEDDDGDDDSSDSDLVITDFRLSESSSSDSSDSSDSAESEYSDDSSDSSDSSEADDASEAGDASDSGDTSESDDGSDGSGANDADNEEGFDDSDDSDFEGLAQVAVRYSASKRKRDVYDPEDSDDEAPTPRKALKVDKKK